MKQSKKEHSDQNVKQKSITILHVYGIWNSNQQIHRTC